MTTTGDSTTDASTGEGRNRIERYDPAAIEPRWQARWDELGLYATDLHDGSRPKFYLLTMYDYPSGSLHIGHWYVKTPTDAIGALPPDARRQRVHAGRASTPSGCPPRTPRSRTGSTRANGRWRTSRRCAASCGRWARRWDWNAEVVTCDPEYYRWNQWLFVQFLKAGPRLSIGVAGRLVPQRRHAGARAGRGRGPPLLALRREGREARARAVVPADHGLRRRAARLRRHRLARPDPDHADQLDRALDGRRDRVRDRALAPPRGRRGAARVHDPPGHAVRGDVHGPRARASAGRRR